MKINAYQGQSTKLVDLIKEGRPIYDKYGEYDGDEGNSETISIDPNLHLSDDIVDRWAEYSNGDFQGDITIDSDNGSIENDGGFEKEYNTIKSKDPGLAQTLLNAFLEELENYGGVNTDSYWVG